MRKPQETSRAKHTPGPWVVQDETVIWTALHDPVETTYDIGTPIADVRRLKSLGGPAYDDREVIANARLIAAAPELLDALREVAEYLGDPDPAPSFPSVQHAMVSALIRNVRAAIAKATGA